MVAVEGIEETVEGQCRGVAEVEDVEWEEEEAVVVAAAEEEEETWVEDHRVDEMVIGNAQTQGAVTITSRGGMPVIDAVRRSRKEWAVEVMITVVVEEAAEEEGACHVEVVIEVAEAVEVEEDTWEEAVEWVVEEDP